MRKVKSVDVGMLVAVPDRMCYPGRLDPYEYENGVVERLGKNKAGKQLAEVTVWRNFSKTTYTKWFLVQMLSQVSYYHYVGEKEDFLAWAATV